MLFDYWIKCRCSAWSKYFLLLSTLCSCFWTAYQRFIYLNLRASCSFRSGMGIFCLSSPTSIAYPASHPGLHVFLALRNHCLLTRFSLFLCLGFIWISSFRIWSDGDRWWSHICIYLGGWLSGLLARLQSRSFLYHIRARKHHWGNCLLYL